MDHLSLQLEAAMIAPIRDEAITQLAGPQVFQIRRFSSIPESRRPRTSINLAAKIAGRVFTLPLLGHWWIYQQD
jgi:hypothetical protein